MRTSVAPAAQPQKAAPARIAGPGPARRFERDPFELEAEHVAERLAPRSPMEIRDFFAPRLGGALDGVRLHTDAAAQSFAERLDARAVTVGSDVYFNAGQYAPSTRDGRALLAHELTHVIQQQHVGTRTQRAPKQPQPKTDAGPRPRIRVNGQEMTDLEYGRSLWRASHNFWWAFWRLEQDARGEAETQQQHLSQRGVTGAAGDWFRGATPPDLSIWRWADPAIVAGRALLQQAEAKLRAWRLLEAQQIFARVLEQLEVAQKSLDAAEKQFRDYVGRPLNPWRVAGGVVVAVAGAVLIVVAAPVVVGAVAEAAPVIANTARALLLTGSLTAPLWGPAAANLSQEAPVIAEAAPVLSEAVPLASQLAPSLPTLTQALPTLAQAAQQAAPLADKLPTAAAAVTTALAVGATALSSDAPTPIQPPRTEPPKKDDEEEKKRQKYPLRWIPRLDYAPTTTSGGRTGALDFNFRGDGDYKVTVPLGGGFTIDAANAMPWNGHHSWPMLLGGVEKQPLMTVRQALHLSLLHPLLLWFLRARGHAVTGHTTDPSNQRFIARLQQDAEFRAGVRDDLEDFYDLLNTVTRPVMPRDAFGRGIDTAHRAFGLR